MTANFKNLPNLPNLTPARLQSAIDHLIDIDRPRFRRLWAYYQNPLRVDPACPLRPYRQAQEWGLPSRITGHAAGAEPFTGRPTPPIQRKEVVIENDIGWRVETIVDYLFGKPIVIRSSAPDPARRATLDTLIQAILAANGGILFLQQLALMGCVHGFADVLVKLDNPARAPADTASSPAAPGQRLDEHPCTSPSLGQPPANCAAEPAQHEAATAAPSSPQPDPGAEILPLEALNRLARLIRLEIVEPARAVPLLSCHDYRILDAYAQHYDVNAPTPADPPAPTWLQRLLGPASPFAAKPATQGITQIITPTLWQRYRDGKLSAQGENSLGEIPLVHIQNVPLPFEYSGASDVEPLLPLQDELNTRLCDRAHRLSLQSFKMYLAKGVDNFPDMPVSPGRMWSTDNDSATIQEFGGDSACPSEESHIADIREALDKTSGVSPIAAGAIKNRIGRLTSAAALRITLISLLAKTEKKRTTYGAGIARIVDLSLRWLDRAGLFATTPRERQIEIHWPSPLPENEAEKLAEAEIKLRVGIPQEIVLRELGY